MYNNIEMRREEREESKSYCIAIKQNDEYASGFSAPVLPEPFVTGKDLWDRNNIM